MGVSSALALVLGGIAFGGDGADAPAPVSWSDLDLAIARLSSSGDEDPFSYGFLLRPFYTVSAKEAAGSAADTSGLVFEDVDAYFAYREGDVAWRVSADFADGNLELEDAHASWSYAEWLNLKMGQFKPRVVRSGSIPSDGLLFRERSFLGAAFDQFDDGFELGGHYDQFDYWFSLTDAENGEASDHLGSVRAEWAIYDDAQPDIEGARGSPNFLRMVLGAFMFEDVALSASDGGGYGGDFVMTFGPYSFYAEWADLDDEFTRTIDVFNGALLSVGDDGQPFSATLSRSVCPQGEAALRFQRADDADNTEATGVSVNWSVAESPVRWVLDAERVEGDTQDFTLFSLGLCAGTSGSPRPFAPQAR